MLHFPLRRRRRGTPRAVFEEGRTRVEGGGLHREKKDEMALPADELTFPTLFAHSLRKDWGVGVLAGEKDGKRRYLFENGEERTLASGFDQLMKRVERPTSDQQLAFARLQGVLAGRAKSGGEGGKPAAFVLSGQLAKLRETYPAGFSDPNWIEDVRGGANGRLRTALAAAEEQLSAKALDSLTNRSPADVASGTRGPRVERARSNGAARAHTVEWRARAAWRDSRAPSRYRRLRQALRQVRCDIDDGVWSAVGWELVTASSARSCTLSITCASSRRCSGSRSRRLWRSVPFRRDRAEAGYATFLSVARLIANKLTEQERSLATSWTCETSSFSR